MTDSEFNKILVEADNLCKEIDTAKDFKQLRKVVNAIDSKLDRLMDIIDSEDDEDYSELNQHYHMN